MGITWKPVASFHPYEASDDGQVRRGERIMTQRGNGSGYLRITVSCAGMINHPYVHQMVCEAFHGPRPRVANALPAAECPDWLAQYRDPPIVQSA